MTERKTRWTGGRRDLPSNWNKIREEVFKRDGYQCTQALPKTGKRCPRGRSGGYRIECDHIGDKHDHSLANLTTLCQHHHEQRTAAQGVAAREQKKAPKRPEERHPMEGR